MSNAFREQKCFSFSTTCAAQISPPVQRRTASGRPVLGLMSRTAWLLHTGQTVGEDIGLRILGPAREIDVDDLRDDVAGALHRHRVADPEILALADRLAVGADALDVVLVVERGVGDDHAADGDRLEARHRCQRPGAADLDVDAAKDGLRLLGGELVGDRPARAPRHEAEPCLQVEAVDLVDDAVDVVAERGAARLLLAVEFERLADSTADPHARVGREAPLRRTA